MEKAEKLWEKSKKRKNRMWKERRVFNIKKQAEIGFNICQRVGIVEIWVKC